MWVYELPLTYWGWDKWIPFCKHFQIQFLSWRLLYFDSSFMVICSHWQNKDKATNHYVNQWSMDWFAEVQCIGSHAIECVTWPGSAQHYETSAEINGKLQNFLQTSCMSTSKLFTIVLPCEILNLSPRFMSGASQGTYPHECIHVCTEPCLMCSEARWWVRHTKPTDSKSHKIPKHRKSYHRNSQQNIRIY